MLVGWIHMRKTHNPCLILNIDYTPLNIINWQKAMVWAIRCHGLDTFPLRVIDYYVDDFVMGTNSQKHLLPAVMQTTKYFRIPVQNVNFSRKNLFIRDNFTCQYCGNRFHSSQLTYDHVIPKSKWKHTSPPTSWTNIVTACQTCNRKKGNKTPQQANMQMLSAPSIPTRQQKYLPVMTQLHSIDMPEVWLSYIAHII